MFDKHAQYRSLLDVNRGITKVSSIPYGCEGVFSNVINDDPFQGWGVNILIWNFFIKENINNKCLNVDDEEGVQIM